MTDKKPSDITVVPSKGILKEFVLRLKLVLQLIGDRRVNFLLKLLPVATIAYLIYPFDLIAVIPGLSALDDIAIVSLGNYLFVELCPPSVVKEHLDALSSNLVDSGDDVVEAEVKDISNEK